MKRFLLVLIVLIAALAIFAIYWRSFKEKPLVSKDTVATSSLPAAAVMATKTKAEISVNPANIVQGDPVFISTGTSTSSVKSIQFNGKKLPIIDVNNIAAALGTIDLRARTGTYSVVVSLNDGTVLNKSIRVATRTTKKEELGIPDKLGGNTSSGVKNVTTTLVNDNQAISSVISNSKQLWRESFRYPLDGPITITDPYGDTRLTVGTTIAHKGADFRATIGTPVFAMNDGVIGFANALKTYGNTIVIDHGLGLETIYMHLSKFNVSKDQTVKKGELIGWSGDTGYVMGPHLHLSIKINGTSIDPIRFMALLGDNIDR